MWHCNGVGAWVLRKFELAWEVMGVVCIEVSEVCIWVVGEEVACTEVW